MPHTDLNLLKRSQMVQPGVVKDLLLLSITQNAMMDCTPQMRQLEF